MSTADATNLNPAMRPIVILGPTAGGKSDLAVTLANRCDPPGQIISADSMQVYRHMDAGTAKPSPMLRQQAKHHLIDCVEPTETFTVTDWLTQVDALIDRLRGEGVRPIIVGGTNLYINALLHGMFDGPDASAELRETLRELTNEQLHGRLSAIDPAAAERIHRNDRRRMTRAIEVFETTGKPISELQTQWQPDAERGQYRYDPILLGLTWPTEAINRRINLRVRYMFDPQRAVADGLADWWPMESLPDETARLEQAGLLGEQAREALGYKQVLAALKGQMSMDDAFERTKVLTRRFGKQQRTWLRRFAGVRWLNAEGVSGEVLAATASELCRG